MLQSIHAVFDEANIRLVWVSDKADDAVWETSLDAENRTLGNVRGNRDAESSGLPKFALRQSFFAVSLLVFSEVKICSLDVAGLEERVAPTVKERSIARPMPRLAPTNEAEFVEFCGFACRRRHHHASKTPAILSPMILSSSRAWAFKVSLFISFLPFSSIWTAAIV